MSRNGSWSTRASVELGSVGDAYRLTFIICLPGVFCYGVQAAFISLILLLIRVFHARRSVLTTNQN